MKMHLTNKASRTDYEPGRNSDKKSMKGKTTMNTYKEDPASGLSALQKNLLLVIFETYNDPKAEYEAPKTHQLIMGQVHGAAAYVHTADVGPLVLWRGIRHRKTTIPSRFFMNLYHQTGNMDYYDLTGPISGVKSVPEFVSRQSLNRALIRLEERGLVRRWAKGEGKYTKWVNLTLTGMAAANALAIEYAA